MAEQDLWISGLPSPALEEDLEGWRRAVAILDGLATAFVPVKGSDAAFAAIVDAKTRSQEQVRRIEGRPAKVCAIPCCSRPARPPRPDDDRKWCREHLWEYDARSEFEAYEHARSVLGPLAEAMEEYGSPELSKVMTEALAGVNASLEAAKSNPSLLGNAYTTGARAKPHQSAAGATEPPLNKVTEL